MAAQAKRESLGNILPRVAQFPTRRPARDPRGEVLQSFLRRLRRFPAAYFATSATLLAYIGLNAGKHHAAACARTRDRVRPLQHRSWHGMNGRRGASNASSDSLLM